MLPIKTRWLVSRTLAAALLLPALAQAEKTRPAAVAGSFYPADRNELQTTVDKLLAQAPAASLQGRLWAIVAPHAGYPYSGAVAAQAYAQLKGRHYRRVVVIAPSHYEEFPFASIYSGDFYSTPLGRVAVDKEFAARLAAADPRLQLSSRGHLPAGDRSEHALEVQLPFLQRALGEFQVVPIVMGEQNYEISRALGVALAQAIRSPDTLIVASSDLSHYHPYEQASAMDRKLLRALQDWDYFTLARNAQARAWEACGFGPIVAAMVAAERLGANSARLLQYANSGDVTADKSRVVGYGAAALIESEKAAAAPVRRYSLSQPDKSTLLDIARQSVEYAVRRQSLLSLPVPASDALLEERGAFVTLTRHGELRGCIGYATSLKPLYLTVRDVAAFAALRDPRFPPVTAAELPDLEYEISVLSPFRRVADVKQIQVGTHGLYIKNAGQEGVLLPQVAVEQRWDRRSFLEQVSLKAGLPREGWRDPGSDLFSFTALVFGGPENSMPAGSPDQAMPPAPTPGWPRR